MSSPEPMLIVHSTRKVHMSPARSRKNQRPAFANAGQWGLFKVLPVGDQRLLPLMPQIPPTKTAEGENADGEVLRTSMPGR